LKKIFLPLIILFLVANSFASFRAHNLSLSGYDWTKLQFLKFETKIEIQGLFYQTTISMRVKLGKNRRYYNRCDDPRIGPYEFEWIFDLPDECVITGCKMWDDSTNQYISAQMVDLSTAEAVYDSTRNPHLLLREYRNRNSCGCWDHFYKLIIAPVGRFEEKDITITYLTPCKMYWDVRRISIYSSQFYYRYDTFCNLHADPEFKVIDYDNSDKAPRNVYYMHGLHWRKENGYWYTKVPSLADAFAYNSILRVEMENQSNKFLQTYSDGTNQFYQ